MTLQSLPTLMLEPVVRAALLEDLGRAGDLTTDAIVPASARAETALVARQPGIVAGLDAASLCLPAGRFRDRGQDRAARRQQGQAGRPHRRHRRPDTRHARRPSAWHLNFLGHLSGVATATATLVEAVRGTQSAHLLHAQDHARPARPAEICRSRGRRRQSSLRSRRRRPDQGQPCRRGGWRRGGDPRPPARASAISSRSRSRSIRVDQLDEALAEEGRRRAARQYEPRAARRRRSAASPVAPSPRPRAASRRPRRRPLRPAASIRSRPAGSPTARRCSISAWTGAMCFGRRRIVGCLKALISGA